MAADSSDVDAAIIAKLVGDATLMAILTDGVWVDVAASGKTRHCVVSQVAHHDEYVFDGRVVETFLYLIKAVIQTTSGADPKAAAARIDVLLQDVPLTMTGYGHLLTRREERVRYTEVDEANPDLRWSHRGGRYQVVVAPAS